jgi:hypothetical protein
MAAALRPWRAANVAVFILKLIVAKVEVVSGVFQTAHNRSVYASPPVGGSGSVRLGHFASLHSHGSLRHILPALVLLRKPLFGLAKRHIQPKRYATFALKLVGNLGKNIVDKRT